MVDNCVATLAKPKVLFAFFTKTIEQKVREQEYIKMIHIGPIAETDLAEYEVFWYGPWLSDDWKDINWLLFCKCTEYKPDLLVLFNGWNPEHGFLASPRFIRLVTLYLIRKYLRVKITSILTDTPPYGFVVTDHFARFCDVVFTHEHESVFYGNTAFPDKYFHVNALYSSYLLKADPLKSRDIDVLFIGNSGYKDRQEGLEALKRNGINVTIPGGFMEGMARLSNEEYSAFCKRAKIIVNWNRHISGLWIQPKGRMIETTLAGAMLLCDENEVTNSYFRPNIEYVPFSNMSGLVEKAKYYIAHEKERLEIAINGQKRTFAEHSAEKIVSKMLDVLSTKELYSESEALEGLRMNASGKEVRTALYFKMQLQAYFHEFDMQHIDFSVTLLRKSYPEFVVRHYADLIKRILLFSEWRSMFIRFLLYFFKPEKLKAVSSLWKNLQAGFR